MSGELCALSFGLVSLATVCLVRVRLSLAAEGAIPLWPFFSDLSPSNVEGSTASPGGAYAALFQLAVRWEYPPPPFTAWGVRAPCIRLLSSIFSAKPSRAVHATVKNA
jgi:hypothetical protein